MWFVYVLLGDVGAVLYVQDADGIRDNVLSNLPVDSFTALVVRLAMTMVSECAVFLLLFCFESLFLAQIVALISYVI